MTDLDPDAPILLLGTGLTTVDAVNSLLDQGHRGPIHALSRRRGEFGESESIIDQLPNILADDRGPARGLGRHTVIEPSRVDEHRRLVERLVADSDLSALAGRTADQLEETLVRFGEHEKEISEQRRKVQSVMDACAAEITRRYREGEADVSALLPSES